MPEILSNHSLPEDQASPYLELFDPSQKNRAAQLFGDACRGILEELALNVATAGIQGPLLSDFLLQHADLLRGASGNAFCIELRQLLVAAQDAPGINTPRLMQLLTRACGISSLKELRAARLLVAQDIYPGPELISHLLTLPAERQPGFFQVLDFTMRSIREREALDERNPLALELYYAYLNVDIPLPEFVKMMKLVPAEAIGPVPPHFKPFRISARGVEALTQDTDSTAIAELRERFLQRSQLQAAKDDLARIWHLPGKVLPTKLKTELMLHCALTIADALGQTEQVHISKHAACFTHSNVLGLLPGLLAEEPSWRKCERLWEARNVLKLLGTEATDALRNAPFNRQQQQVLRRSAALACQAEERCLTVLNDEAPRVIASLSLNADGVRGLNALLEVLMGIDLRKDRTPAEEVLQRQLAQGLCLTAFEHLPGLPAEIMHDLLREKTLSLQLAAISGSPAAADELWETVELLALQESPAMAEQVRGGGAEIVLESARELYQEIMPQVLAGAACSEERCGPLARGLREALHRAAEAHILELLHAVQKVVSGAGGFVRQRAQNEELRTAYAVFEHAFSKRLAELARSLKEPPSFVKRWYALDTIGFLAGSCAYHTAERRSLARMLENSELTEDERRIVESVRERLQHIRSALEALAEAAACAEGLWREPLSWEQGLAGLQTLLERCAGQIQSGATLRFPQYNEHLAERERLSADYQERRRTLKNEIYSRYRAEKEEAELPFDQAELQRRLKAPLQEIDQEYSRQLKELRRRFEEQFAPAVRALHVYEKFYGEVMQLIERAALPTGRRQQRLDSVLKELSKVTYRDLEEGEFELVPSKAKGDALKAWVSNDCGKSSDCVRQVLNRNFVNFRVYQRQNGDRLWCGNVYVLDASWGQEAEILFDAIQVSRTTAVNPQMFLRGVVEGFAKMGLRCDYERIVSNVITHTREGYLVSNRPQLRQAYISLYGGKPKLTESPEQRMQIEDRTVADSFQCFSHGNGQFQVLWEHPDVQPEASLEEIEQVLRPTVGTDLIDRLRAFAGRQEYAFRLCFRSTAGLSILRENAADPQSLAAYLSLAEENSSDRVALVTLRQKEKFRLINSLYSCSPAAASAALRALPRAAAEDEQRLALLPDLLNRRPECEAFLTRLLEHGAFLESAAIEENKPVYDRLLELGLGDEYIKALCAGRELAQDLAAIAALLQEGVLSPADHQLAVHLFEKAYCLAGLDLRSLTVQLKRIETLRLRHRPAGESLSAGQVLECIERQRLSGVQEVQEIAEAVADAGTSQRQAFNLKYAGRALASGLLPAQPAGPLLSVLWRAGERPGGDAGLLSAAEVFQSLLQNKGDLGQCQTILEELETGPHGTKGSVLVRRLLESKRSMLPALLLSRAAAGELQQQYFFLSHIEEETLDPEDTLDGLRAKFMEARFKGPGLEALPQLSVLVPSGLGYVFAKREYAEALEGYFDPAELAGRRRCAQGAGLERREKEEIKLGYKGMRDALQDQPRICSLPYHG